MDIPSALLQLPTEMIEFIVVYLPTKDLLSVRLSCPRLERKTLRFYARKHFTTRNIVFTKYNLQTLIDIARHEVFGPQVRELVLVKRPRPHAPLQHQECTHGDVRYLPYILEAEKRLSVALNHLPNLIGVTCSNSYSSQHFSISCHLRILLSAVQVCGAVRLKTLTLTLPLKALLCLDTFSTCINHPYRQLQVQPATAGLCILELGVTGVTVTLPDHDQRHPCMVNRAPPIIVREPVSVTGNGYIYSGQLSAVYTQGLYQYPVTYVAPYVGR
jgi:hypothetical protein